MRAVEQPDVAAWWQLLVNAPQIVVRQFFGRWRLKRRDSHTNRPAGVEHRARRAVLARAIHALQHHQQRLMPLGQIAANADRLRDSVARDRSAHRQRIVYECEPHHPRGPFVQRSWGTDELRRGRTRGGVGRRIALLGVR